MKLDMFKEQLNENKMGDLHARVRELRALNNSGDEICKKIASEFQKDYIDIKKLILPSDLKRYASMSADQLNAVGEDAIKRLKSKYSKWAPKTIRSKKSFLEKLMNVAISRG